MLYGAYELIRLQNTDAYNTGSGNQQNFTFMVGTIYKASPHDDASVWFDGIGKHVGSIGMCAVAVSYTHLDVYKRQDSYVGPYPDEQ